MKEATMQYGFVGRVAGGGIRGHGGLPEAHRYHEHGQDLRGGSAHDRLKRQGAGRDDVTSGLGLNSRLALTLA
jgi:hypothetical protein